MVRPSPRARVALHRGVVVLAVAAGLVPVAGSGAAAQPVPPLSPLTAEHRIEMLREHARAATPEVFATVAGQELHLPRGARKIGFHESGHPAALAMTPIGRLEANHNGERIALPQVHGSRDGGYLVLPTRRRGGGPTTAADLSMRPGEPVTSPVTGTVTAANAYNLYGRTPDHIIEITPAGQPDLRVRLLHVDGVGVSVGDAVEAGETAVAAHARPLPFASQIDRFAGSYPHLHLEVLHRND